MSDSNDVFFPSEFTDSDQGKFCMDTVYSFYRLKRFLDATFSVGGVTFEVHKIVMAANSSYFMEKLNDTDVEYDLTELAEFDPAAMAIVIHYCYTGKLDVDSDNIVNVINLADFLKITAIVSKLTGNNDD